MLTRFFAAVAFISCAFVFLYLLAAGQWKAALFFAFVCIVCAGGDG